MKKTLKDFTGLFLVAGMVVLLDQTTKHIVRSNLPIGQVFHPELWITQYVRIVHWYNTGVAGGLFQNMNTVHIVLNLIIGCVLIYLYARTPKDERLIRLALGLMLGGGIGNIIDRLTQGHVTDFISVGNFPVLNIADACVSIGAALLFFSLIKNEIIKKDQPLVENEEQAVADQPDQPPAETSPSSVEENQG